MCIQNDDSFPSRQDIDSDKIKGTECPDWETILLPPDHILSHLTDAHCHPTDLNQTLETYDNVKLGGLASMATIPTDQDRVKSLSRDRPWNSKRDKGKGKEGKGVGVVACFGYHPWFTHQYTLQSPKAIPSKEEHYFSLFAPTSDKNKDLLNMLLPYLPDPLSFDTLLYKLKEDIQKSLSEGRLTMLGEVGLDGSARMRWPKSARHLHPDFITTESTKDEDEDSEWRRLTPFKVPMNHQRSILEKQMDLAVELGVNVSFHSVACAGPSLDTLISMRNRHGIRFTNRINVDLHSAGGWSPEFWKQAERNLSNLYASPSIFITSRSPSASSLIAAISKDRMLIESDSHDVTLSDRLVWAATEWISRCKGWKLESRDEHPFDIAGKVEDWNLYDDGMEEEEIDHKGDIIDKKDDDIWTVRKLERNWMRFIKLIED
ncbi:uncharacterized protein I206_107367 [Kwoniella pini CBS 10737]|uniref:TatD DNase n=1 Tax=Kwoniella pini CBS 10737 TaxID=1296096 RepID=A0A1B9HX38_9TREE|nr:uncharacterized protein I206_05693 [Kwoniella pini CBS 10737]OCF47833.1 hypothetical protein I206_05693 [Kwoniella pini CBS 10737]